jgi:hypothetical protein
MILMSWLAVAVVAAGCRRAVDTRDAEEKVKNIAEATMKSPVASVRCPAAERNAGVSFSCDVTFAEGGTHKLKVVITDNHGNFLPSWEVPVISMTRLAESIAEATRVETATEARVTCGSGVAAIGAEPFPCTVSIAGVDRAVAVRVDPQDASWELIER